MSDSSRRAKGQRGEDMAAAYLQGEGYIIMERNFRSRSGELDLVCHRDGVIVFVEVKTRHSLLFGSGAEGVTRSKQARIRRLALEYLNFQEEWWSEIRFDVISILWHDEKHHSLEHFQAAFY